MSEFSDRPFVMGSLTGVRSFKVDRLGRLTGVSYPEVWKPGVNHAGCGRTGPTVDLSSMMFSSFTRSMRFTVVIPGRNPAPPAPVSLVKKARHRPGQLDCNCGYYAYFDNGTNPHHGNDQVVGIVEAHGVTTVGSRGFRAEKAEIVALVDPYDKRIGRPLDGLAGNLYPIAPLLSGIAFGLGVAATTGAVVMASPWLSPLLAIAALAFFTLIYLAFRSITVHHDRPDPQRTPFELVRANYPTVPVYPSKRAALRHHPLTPPPLPAAPTPDTDPEFWTRSVL